MQSSKSETIMPSRIELIRERFLRRLHRFVFRAVPNTASAEVDLSKLKATSEEALPEVSMEWSLEDAPDVPLNPRKPGT
jgi:dihydroneopterin aldolase